MVADQPISPRHHQNLVTDFHRPHYHFLPPTHWMNDPNGVIQWQGTYHLFYQHNPDGPLWGNMHWGHASSLDLIHWADLPIAIAPTPNGYDAAGIFSGCAVNHNGTPTIFYTGTQGEKHDIQVQCMATSSDNLLTWEKYPGNPVISNVPAESGQTADFRDPFVWQEADAWYMVVGSRIKDVGGAVFLYRSHNLIDWDYLHPLLVGDIRRNGMIWECPNFFKLGENWVLIISSHFGSMTGDVIYFVGTYVDHHFTPLHEGILEYGRLYAPLTTLDEQARRLLFGWVRESRSNEAQQAAGWSGVQSIPRVLALDRQYRLLMTPIAELEMLRGHHHHEGPMDVTDTIPLAVTGLALEIAAEFMPQPDGSCGFSLACAPNNAERIDIVYEADQQRLIVRTISADDTVLHIDSVPHPLADDESLQLRILLDGSVVEIIANQRTSITGRVYSSDVMSNGVRLLGAKTHLHSLDIWMMSSIWQ